MVGTLTQNKCFVYTVYNIKLGHIINVSGISFVPVANFQNIFYINQMVVTYFELFVLSEPHSTEI